MNTKDSKSPVIERLKIYLESQVISNSSFSEKTGLSTTSVSRILTGKVDPHKSTIQKVLKCYPNLNPNWLFNGEGEMLQEPGQTTINWKEEAYQLIKDENTFLKRQLETLTNALNAVLKSQNPNFRKATLQAAKFILESQGTLAGGPGLRKVA